MRTDHVYYVDGKDSHGAVKYFEYPNVFAAVLMEDVLGISRSTPEKIVLRPHLSMFGQAEFDTPGYALRYAYTREVSNFEIFPAEPEHSGSMYRRWGMGRAISFCVAIARNPVGRTRSSWRHKSAYFGRLKANPRKWLLNGKLQISSVLTEMDEAFQNVMMIHKG